MSDKTETADVAIFDSYGKIVNSSKLNLTKGENLLKLPGLYDQAAGTYLVRIKTSGGYITQKVLLTQ